MLKKVCLVVAASISIQSYSAEDILEVVQSKRAPTLAEKIKYKLQDAGAHVQYNLDRLSLGERAAADAHTQRLIKIDAARNIKHPAPENHSVASDIPAFSKKSLEFMTSIPKDRIPEEGQPQVNRARVFGRVVADTAKGAVRPFINAGKYIGKKISRVKNSKFASKSKDVSNPLPSTRDQVELLVNEKLPQSDASGNRYDNVVALEEPKAAPFSQALPQSVRDTEGRFQINTKAMEDNFKALSPQSQINALKKAPEMWGHFSPTAKVSFLYKNPALLDYVTIDELTVNRFKDVLIKASKPKFQVELVKVLPKLFDKFPEDVQKAFVRSNRDIVDYVLNSNVISQLADEELNRLDIE